MKDNDPEPKHHRPWEDVEAAVKESIEHPGDYGLRQWSGWVLGPAFLLMTLLFEPPNGLSVEGWRTAGVAGLMAILWISEAIPIPVTALLPMVLFPLLQLSDIRATTAPYANPLIFLFLGGFVIALAMQRWGLHKRLAINLIAVMGTRPHQVVAGFLIASAFVSMWVSNTATTLMMLPIAISVAALLRRDDGSGFGTALMLAVAYGATTGGMGTLIGTPPNALLAGFLDDVYGIRVGFGQWMLIGVPVTLIALPLVYLVLTRVAFRLSREKVAGMEELIAEERGKLGRMSRGEKAVALVFLCTALGWITQPIISGWLPMVSDTTIAIAGAVILFLIPLNLKRGVFAMDWDTAKGLPWEVLILFGGGLSLAANIQRHGLSEWLGTLSAGLGGLPVILLLALICFGILLLTELTSNTATAATFLPVVAAIAISLGENPLLFLIPTALAANCSYMMPVGTPPNAIVFGSGMVSLPQMARTGLLLNIALVPIVVAVVWLLAPLVFGIETGHVPSWAR